MPKYTIEQKRNVVTVRYEVPNSDWDAWVFLRSDVHHDSPHCERNTEYTHLKKVKERDALIFDIGDTFDAMNGKFDPRRNLEDVLPEYAGTNYYDLLVNGFADDYDEYLDYFAMIAKGNHETAVTKNANTDLVSRLVDRMNHNKKDGQRICEGSYGGWVRFMFSIHGKRQSSIKMKYFHGAGGSAPVTKGVIHTNRQSVYLPDADIVANGHNHQAYIVPIARERLSHVGNIEKDICWHIRTPGYKDEYGDGSSGFAVEKGMSPTPLGGCWLHFEYFEKFVKVTPIPEITT